MKRLARQGDEFQGSSIYKLLCFVEAIPPSKRWAKDKKLWWGWGDGICMEGKSSIHIPPVKKYKQYQQHDTVPLSHLPLCLMLTHCIK